MHWTEKILPVNFTHAIMVDKRQKISSINITCQICFAYNVNIDKRTLL